MGWMGKLVGGTIGFALGGPLGAIFGAAFGHAFDAGSELETAENRQRLSTIEQHQLTLEKKVEERTTELLKAKVKQGKRKKNTVAQGSYSYAL